MLAAFVLQCALTASPLPPGLHLLPRATAAVEQGAPSGPEPRHDPLRGGISGGEVLAGTGVSLLVGAAGVGLSALTWAMGLMLDVSGQPNAYSTALRLILYEWVGIALIQPFILTPLEEAMAGRNKAGTGWIGLGFGFIAEAGAIGLTALALLVPSAGAWLLGALLLHLVGAPLLISYGLHFPYHPEPAAEPPPGGPAVSTLDRAGRAVAVPLVSLAF